MWKVTISKVEKQKQTQKKLFAADMIEKKANFKESLERRDRDRKISEEGRKEGREEEETSLKM